MEEHYAVKRDTRMMPSFSPETEALFQKALVFMEAEGMVFGPERGVLLALSGGADSVFLCYLLDYLRRKTAFPLMAMHVHHHIRGDEADRDAEFCRRLAQELSIPFVLSDVDVPLVAAEEKRGLEAVARRLRYSALREELARHPELSVIATAHHGTDHMETVFLHILRGGGSRALVGIRPVHGDLIRPLLPLSGEEIRSALAASSLSYMNDSTNADTAYSRNFMRCHILPSVYSLAPRAEEAVFRMSEAVSQDILYLDELAVRALSEAPRNERGVDASYLRELPEAIRRRVLVRLYEAAREAMADDIAIEHQHIVMLSALLQKKENRDFSVSVPNRLVALLRDGYFSFSRSGSEEPPAPYIIPLLEGENVLPGGFRMILSVKEGTMFVACSSNLYKIDTETAISSAIIQGRLYVRPRREGDTCFFRKHTHSLKKLYNEKKIPRSARACLPLLCDDAGVLWVPFCPPREKPPVKAE